MSLQVWLPLTKDTRQQGLSNISVTGTPASWGNGKLGKCATWNGAVANVLYNNTTDFNYTNNFSVAFWANPIYTGSTAQYAWTVGRADAGGYGYGFQIISATTARFRFGNGSYGVSAPSNEWHHFAMTIGNSKVTIYKDGIQVGSNNLPGTIPTYSDGNGMGLGCFHYSGNIYPYYGSLNDFRIYDHCLSQMEVKELSKGLVLHYPLNRQGWGQENLLLNSNIEKSGKNTIITYDLSTEGITAVKGATMRISADIKSDVANATIDCYVRSSTRNSMCSNTIFTGIGTTYQRYTMTTVCNTNQGQTPQWFAFRSNGSNGTTTTATFTIKNVKLEKGSIATPWCPNSSDALATTMGLNSTTEYDCSGFCNNGIRTGTFTWTSDTPKYNVSTQFSGTQYITEDNEIETTDSTIAAWVKTSLSANAFILDCRNSSGVGKQPIFQYTNGSIQSGGTSQYVTTNTGLLVANTWIHLAIVQSGSSLLVYKNGSLFQTLSCTNSPIIKLTVGARYSLSSLLPSGSISDVRIYATALSASDVKSLYQNSAYIDSSGNVYGAVHTEV